VQRNVLDCVDREAAVLGGSGRPTRATSGTAGEACRDRRVGSLDSGIPETMIQRVPYLRRPLLVIGFALAAACLVLGLKLVTINAYGSDVPYMDEWDAVGRVLLLPRSTGELRPAHFLEPQNEHRIVLSRLIAYSLLVANRQWDATLEMTVSAVIHSCFCAALLLFARRYARGFRFAAVGLATLALFVLAFDWENTLQGIQSQFYLLEWGAFGMVLLCVPSEPLSGRWCLGWLVGALSLGTMSSGFMAAATVLFLLAVRSVIRGRITGRDAAGIAALLLLCIAGYSSVARVPGHDGLRAHSLWQWFQAAAGALSWPMTDRPVAFMVLQLPVCLLTARCIRRRTLSRDEAVLLALALWTWMQMAAIAWGRANEGMFRSPRFADLYAVGSFANILALAVLWGSGRGARACAWVAAVWMVLFSSGLWARTRETHEIFLDDFPRLKEMERRNVRSYLATHDLAQLRAANPHELPYPRADFLGTMLSTPAIVAVLPVGIRPPIALSPDAGSVGFAASTEAASNRGATSRVWTAQRGPARFVSRPLPGDVLAYLHLAIAGSPDLNASLLRVEASDGTGSAAAFDLQGARWHTTDVAVPGGTSLRLVVDIPKGDHWFSFTEPVEMGRGSWMNHWLLRRSGAVAALSAILVAFLGSAILVVDLRSRSPTVAAG
jgi:hypothetical protein